MALANAMFWGYMAHAADFPSNDAVMTAILRTGYFNAKNTQTQERWSWKSLTLNYLPADILKFTRKLCRNELLGL